MHTLHNDQIHLKDNIRAEANRLGFSLCGFTSVDPPAEYGRYEKWLSKGLHAEMIYLNSNYHRTIRQYPNQLVPDAKTIISLGWPYRLQQMEENGLPNEVLVAGYTAGKDYHQILPLKLTELIRYIQNEIGTEVQTRVFTDSAPILEREIGSRAGLGWIGRNSCLISPTIGSSFLLAEIFIDYPFQIDPPYKNDLCGTCHRCMDACPTGCIQTDRTLDSSRCISYLTIENKNNIPEDLRSKIGKWLFGCDICQLVCPWNRKTLDSSIKKDYPQTNIEDIHNLLSISPEEFLNKFKESSFYRGKLKGLQRNTLIWIGNNGSSKYAALLEKFKQQASNSELLACAEWAIKQIKIN
jgi:epoxyqueuosine reductase